MPERMDLDHGSHDVAGNQRIAHASVRLSDAVTDIAHREDGWLAAGFENAVADLFDERSKVECARVALTMRAVNQHLWLAKVLLGPVHAKPQRIALEVHLAQPLTAQLPRIVWHVRALLRRPPSTLIQ